MRQKIKIRKLRKDEELPDQSVSGSGFGKQKGGKKPFAKNPAKLKRSYADAWDS